MVASTRLLALLRPIGRLDSHVRQLVALVIAVVFFVFHPAWAISNHPLHRDLGHLRDGDPADGMGHDLHGESSGYPAKSQTAGFKQDLYFHFHHRRSVHELACSDAGSSGTQSAPKVRRAALIHGGTGRD